jgi:hypothetical protein
MTKKIDYRKAMVEACHAYVIKLMDEKLASGWSWEMLAKETGLDDATLRRWQVKTVNPMLENLFHVISKLGGSIMEAITAVSGPKLAYLVGELEKNEKLLELLFNALQGQFREKLISDLVLYNKVQSEPK